MVMEGGACPSPDCGSPVVLHAAVWLEKALMNKDPSVELNLQLLSYEFACLKHNCFEYPTSSLCVIGKVNDSVKLVNPRQRSRRSAGEAQSRNSPAVQAVRALMMFEEGEMGQVPQQPVAKKVVGEPRIQSSQITHARPSRQTGTETEVEAAATHLTAAAETTHQQSEPRELPLGEPRAWSDADAAEGEVVREEEELDLISADIRRQLDEAVEEEAHAITHTA